jgi:hypothetical protein
MMARGWRGVRAVAALVIVAGMLGGCQVLYLLLGQGDQPALYKFGNNQRVLVLVDIADGVSVPPAFATSLADQVGLHLLRYKAADALIPQERLIKLQQTNPEAYRKLGVADVAQDTDADQVLQVSIMQMAVIKTADGTVAEGRAAAYVKVCDRKGRVWPADSKGQLVEGRVDMGLLRDKGSDDIMKEMTAQLTLRTGRMFHSYAIEDHEMSANPGTAGR